MDSAALAKEAYVVRGCLNAHDQTKLVVHFDGNWSDNMFETCAQDAAVEAIAAFALEIAVQLATEEGGNVIRLDSVCQGFQQGRIEGLQVLAAFEHQISGEFSLHDAPPIAHTQVVSNRAILLGEPV